MFIDSKISRYEERLNQIEQNASDLIEAAHGGPYTQEESVLLNSYRDEAFDLIEKITKLRKRKERIHELKVLFALN